MQPKINPEVNMKTLSETPIFVSDILKQLDSDSFQEFRDQHEILGYGIARRNFPILPDDVVMFEETCIVLHVSEKKLC